MARPVGLQHIDHIVGNVGWNAMDEWVDFYSHVMGFSLYQHFDDNDISTEYSALMSKVMANASVYIKFPINEPAEGRRKSQIEEYLDFYNGPGVQHLALATHDILSTVARMQEQGVSFLSIPLSYYTQLQERVGKIDACRNVTGHCRRFDETRPRHRRARRFRRRDQHQRRNRGLVGIP